MPSFRQFIEQNTRAMKYILPIIFCSLLLVWPHLGNSQIIETIEQSVESGGSNSNEGGTESSGSNGVFNSGGGEIYYEDFDDGIGFDVDVLDLEGFYFMARATGFLFFGVPDGQNPFAVAENGGVEFAEYPYDEAKSGLFRRPGEWGFRSRTYAGLHFLNNEQSLSGGFLQIRYSPIRALSIEFNHLQLVEKVEDQEEFDLLGFSTLGMHYNRLRHHRVHAWWGVGVTQMRGEENYTGPALLFGTTLFIKRPLSLHLEGQTMWLNGLPVQFYQARIQTHLKRFQIYTGYQGIVLDYNHFPSWTLGTGLWF